MVSREISSVPARAGMKDAMGPDQGPDQRPGGAENGDKLKIAVARQAEYCSEG